MKLGRRFWGVRWCMYFFVFLMGSLECECLFGEPSSLGGADVWCAVPKERYKSVLKEMAERVKVNYSQIKSWQGSCELFNQEYYNDRTIQEIAPSIDEEVVSCVWSRKSIFVIDHVTGRCYSKSDVPDLMVWSILPSGKELTIPHIYKPACRCLLMNSEVWEHVCGRFDDKDDGRVFKLPQGNVSRRHENDKKHTMCYMVNPMERFRCTGRLTHELLMMMHDLPAEKASQIMGNTQKPMLTVQLQGESPQRKCRIISVGYVIPDNKDIVSVVEYVFDEQYAFNYTRIISHYGDKEVMSINLDYENREGVMLPSEYKKCTRDSRGRVQKEEREQYFTDAINKTISDSVFSIQNLELEDGIQINDYIENTKYLYDNGKLVPVMKDAPVK